MLHDDRRRAESFGAQAERYDRVRPGYPAALFDTVLGSTPAALSVLDVGCGTGIASCAMAARGADVLGVEVDGRMASLARSRGIPVEVAGFEAWDAAGRRFDRVTAAQAWHWVDPVAGAAKAAAVLRPGGRLCVWWNVGTLPAELSGALAEVYAQVAPGTDGYSVLLGYSGNGRGSEIDGMRACPDLGEPVVQRFAWTRSYTRDEWLDQLPTHSDHSSLPPDRLEAVLAGVGDAVDAAGGSFEMSYVAVLVSAERR